MARVVGAWPRARLRPFWFLDATRRSAIQRSFDFMYGADGDDGDYLEELSEYRAMLVADAVNMEVEDLIRSGEPGEP
jgi:hypothetical protein